MRVARNNRSGCVNVMVGKPISLAHTLPVPTGNTPIAVSLPTNPSTTSRIVPSPPATSTTLQFAATAARANAVASPGLRVERIVTCQPRSPTYSTTRCKSRRNSARGPAVGL